MPRRRAQARPPSTPAPVGPAPEPPPRRQFLVFPAEEVAFLRSLLCLYLGANRVEEVLRLYGRTLGRSMSSLAPNTSEVGTIATRLGAQVGLGQLRHTSTNADGSWVVEMDRLAEPLGGPGSVDPPVFTAGVLEGIFEGLLGVRVSGELERDRRGRWVLTVQTLASQGPQVRGSARLPLPGPRAYRLEVTEPDDFFRHVAPHLLSGSSLCITREAPRQLSSEYGLKLSEIVWLAVTPGLEGPTVHPHQLGHLLELVDGFERLHRPPSLVAVQGLDFLFEQNEPATVLRLLELMVERVGAAGGSLVVEVPAAELARGVVGQLRRILPDRFPAGVD